METKQILSRGLGYAEAVVVIWAVMSTFWISIVYCETEAESVSFFVQIMLLTVFLGLSRRAVNAGFCFGYVVSVTVIVASAWFFSISDRGISDIWLFGGLILGGLLDIVRTYLLTNNQH